MSFLAFLIAGGVLGLVFYGAQALKSNVVLDLSGDKEVITQTETVDLSSNDTEETVDEAVVEEETTEEATEPEETTEENTTEEETTEEEPAEESTEEESAAYCNEDVSLTIDEAQTLNGKTVTMTLGAEHAAMINVGGKSAFMDVGDRTQINGLDISLEDAAESSAVIHIYC